MSKQNMKFHIIGVDLKPVTEEKRASVLLHMSSRIRLMKKAALVQKYPESYIEELNLLLKDIENELLILVPKIPEYKL